MEEVQNGNKMQITNQPNLPIGWFKCYKEVITTAGTYCTVFAISSVGGFVCAFFMKKIDLTNFEAAVLVNAQRNGVTLLASAPMFTLGSLIAQYSKGHQSRDEMARLQQAGWIVAAATFIPSAVIYSLSKQIFILLRQPSAVAEIAQPFFWGFMPGALAHCLTIGSLQFPSGLNKRVALILIDLFVLGVSIGSTRIFALGVGKIPRLGMVGYGYAQSIATSTYLVLCSLLLAFKKEFKRYQLYSPRGHWLSEILKILKLSIPNIAGVLGEVAIFLAFPLLAGALNNTSLAAQGIITFYTGLILISNMSFFRASTILAASALGAERYKDISRITIANLSLTVIIPFIGLILTTTIPKKLADAFITGVPLSSINDTMINNTSSNSTQLNNTEIYEMLKDEVYAKLKFAFPIAALGSLFDAVRMALIGLLIGLNAAKVPGAVTLGVQLFIILPLMYALSFHTSLGITGMQIAYAIGGLLLSSFMLYRVYVWKPDNENVLQENNTTELDPSFKPAEDSNIEVVQNTNKLSIKQENNANPVLAESNTSLQVKTSWWSNPLSLFKCCKPASSKNISHTAHTTIGLKKPAII